MKLSDITFLACKVDGEKTKIVAKFKYLVRVRQVVALLVNF